VTAIEAIERQSKHENLISELTTLLMRANAGLWVAELGTTKCNFKDLRAEISAAITKADKEAMQ
jgi:hypothetical protein